ncbi:hypothetical protein ACOIDF_31015, partial [Klebsiella pneumoniae]
AKKITTILNKYINKNKTTSTKLIKSTLNNTFQKTITKNHITTNHITTTHTTKSKIKKSKLTTNKYLKIYQTTTNHNH